MSDALKPQLHGRDHRPGGRDPIPNTGAGLSFCYAETSSASSGSVSANSFKIADFGTGTSFKTNDSTLFPAIYHDTGKTPAYGIRIPANYLAEVRTWVWIGADIADGPHEVSSVVDGAYSPFVFGPASHSDATSYAFSATGLADDKTAPEALVQTEHLGWINDWTVGTIHRWQNFTTDPIFFMYGISVVLLGSLPT